MTSSPVSLLLSLPFTFISPLLIFISLSSLNSILKYHYHNTQNITSLLVRVVGWLGGSSNGGASAAAAAGSYHALSSGGTNHIDGNAIFPSSRTTAASLTQQASLSIPATPSGALQSFPPHRIIFILLFGVFLTGVVIEAISVDCIWDFEFLWSPGSNWVFVLMVGAGVVIGSTCRRQSNSSSVAPASFLKNISSNARNLAIELAILAVASCLPILSFLIASPISEGSLTSQLDTLLIASDSQSEIPLKGLIYERGSLFLCGILFLMPICLWLLVSKWRYSVFQSLICASLWSSFLFFKHVFVILLWATLFKENFSAWSLWIFYASGFIAVSCVILLLYSVHASLIEYDFLPWFIPALVASSLYNYFLGAIVLNEWSHQKSGTSNVLSLISLGVQCASMLIVLFLVMKRSKHLSFKSIFVRNANSADNYLVHMSNLDLEDFSLGGDDDDDEEDAFLRELEEGRNSDDEDLYDNVASLQLMNDHEDNFDIPSPHTQDGDDDVGEEGEEAGRPLDESDSQAGNSS